MGTLLRLLDVVELGDFGALGCTKVLSFKHLNLNRSKNTDIAGSALVFKSTKIHVF